MASMSYMAMFTNVTRRVEFDSFNVLYSSATNEHDVVAVIIAKEGIKETLYLFTTIDNFIKDLNRARKADVVLLASTLN